MIKRTAIEEFLGMARAYPVLDVRSPGEYGYAHIPGAYSLPLFTDDERRIVGTAYKQDSKTEAVKIGMDFFGVKMRKMVEEVEALLAGLPTQYPEEYKEGEEHKRKVLLHCWRGGMRTTAVAWLLDLYGFDVYTLDGGYKSFRNWALAQFEKSYDLRVVGGYTGAGKTIVLHELAKNAYAVIDLEAIANHKGSAFGGFDGKQPTQEMFDNLLATELSRVVHHENIANGIWLEDESQRIGQVNVPNTLWKSMWSSPLFFLDIPFEERVDHITEEYGKHRRELLVNAVIRIQKRLGGQNAKDAVNYLLEGDTRSAFAILLHYYDKYYQKSLSLRKGEHYPQIHIPCTGVSAKENVALIDAARLQYAAAERTATE